MEIECEWLPVRSADLFQLVWVQFSLSDGVKVSANGDLSQNVPCADWRHALGAVFRP